MESAQMLSDRALGWLRYIWDKATTPDDWSDRGEPHPWWDRYTAPPMCSFPRFDLPFMAYVLPMMTEATPAWREAYVRIADELFRRHRSFWASIDWNTLIGPDPGVDRYPPEMLGFIPEKLRGRYAAPGWTGNGIEPWGLQPDPIGADGNLFNRGWFNLLLGMRRYVSGKADQDTPFDVTGYQNRQFTWTHARMAALISAQMAARPQGPHCENTKIWPFCVSSAGLGLKLYDALLGTKLHAPFPRWVDYCRKHYMKVDSDNNLVWFLWYYDPMEQCCETFPEKTTAYSALTPMIYLYPQDRAFTEQLYTLSMRLLEWDNPKLPVIDIMNRPLNLATALLMAREFGDSTTEGRLREYLETELEPRFFGAENDRFAFWLGAGTEWPRGQVNAILMLSECGAPGAWWRMFNEPNLKMHSEPTVCDVDYPILGIRRAQNDMGRGVLEIETIAATPSRRGTATQFTVKGLPDPADVVVTVNDQKFTRWHVNDTDAIRIETDVGEHHFRIAFRSGSPPKKTDRIVQETLNTRELIRTIGEETTAMSTQTLSTQTHETAPTRFVEAAGTRFAYRRFGGGTGLPMLFCQHFTGTMDHWDPIVTTALAQDREVILFNNRGVGSSSGKTPESVQAMATDALAFVDALGLKRMDLLGFSLGGMVAQQIVLDRPTLVRYLILAGTGPEGGERIDIGTVPPSSEVLSNKSLSHLDIELRLFFAQSETSQAAGRAFWDRKNWRKADRDPVSSPEVAKAQMIAIKSWGEAKGERYARLKEIQQPTLVFNGINDVMIPTINSYILAEHLPDARLVLYPDSGHGALFQYPHQFCAEVKLFLADRSH